MYWTLKGLLTGKLIQQGQGQIRIFANSIKFQHRAQQTAHVSEKCVLKPPNHIKRKKFILTNDEILTNVEFASVINRNHSNEKPKLA